MTALPTPTVSSREQTVAFLGILIAITIIALAPIVVTAIIQKGFPDSLTAMCDKAVVGLIGVLGTIAGLAFRNSPVDGARADNTGKALEAISAANASNSGQPQPVIVTNTEAAPVPTTDTGA